MNNLLGVEAFFCGVDETKVGRRVCGIAALHTGVSEVCTVGVVRTGLIGQQVGQSALCLRAALENTEAEFGEGSSVLTSRPHM